MLKELAARLKQGYRTIPFPDAELQLPDRFRGRPELEGGKCTRQCQKCVDACPTGAAQCTGTGPVIDLGLCVFCGACEHACTHGAIRFGAEYRLAARDRQDLVLGVGSAPGLVRALDRQMQRLFGRSLRLRQVSAGGCNACEADLNVLSTVVFDLGRFGIQFVASPRHADGIVVTGPVTMNMKLALEKTYAAVPEPKLVIAVGACAISGGLFRGHPEVCNGVTDLLPVDLFIPGCPPHPITILHGLLGLLGRLPRDK